METWKTGWIPWKVSRSQRVKEWVPAFARISKGPRNLSESLWDGWMVWKNLALTKACSPMVQSWQFFCIGRALISELGFGNCRLKFLV